ncbi:MAG: hypothetical protein WBQ17_10715 [Rhizomicrobium sp.]
MKVAEATATRRGYLSSIGTAFAFTIAYALARSLWWPMLIHSFMGLYGAWSGYRLNRNAVA